MSKHAALDTFGKSGNPLIRSDLFDKAALGNEEVTTLTSATENIIVYNLDVTDSPAGNDTYVVNNYVVHNK